MGLGNMGLKMVFLVFMFLNGLLLCTAQYVFNVTSNGSFTRNCATKGMTVVNGMFPGPPIIVEKRDNEIKTVTVTVNNNAGYGVTIHWHGVKQPRNPWSDGPEYVTQCPIKNGTSFTQTIIFSDEVGTLWWHAHSDWTRGPVHGAIIIKPSNGNYPYNPYPDGGEQTIIIASWYNGSVMDEADKAKQNIEPDPADAYTINGYVGSWANLSCTEPTYTMSVTPGKTYLLHIVNAVLNEEMFFAIANHTLTVVTMDGAYVEPLNNTPYIMLGPGNTMDVLVTATKTSGQYYMAARYYHSGGLTVNTKVATGILQYGSDSSAPVFPTTTLPDIDDVSAAESFTDSIRSPRDVDIPRSPIQYITNISVTGADTTNGIRSSLSNIRHVLPSNDFLLNAALSCVQGGSCDNSSVYTPDFPSLPLGTEVNGTRLIVVDYNDVVEIVFQATSQGPEDHPMHLHGHSFYLLGRLRNATFNGSTDPQKYYNLKNPPLLNTAVVPNQGWAAIRFVANNPGVWFIHCHLERHATWGMATTLIVKEGPNLLPRPSNMPSCV